MPSIKGEDVPVDKSSRKSLRKSRSKVCKYNYKNPYFNFLFEFKCLPENKSLTTRQLFKLAGTKWKSLSLEEKKPYVDAAKSDNSLENKNEPLTDANRKRKPGKKSKKDNTQRNNKGQFTRKNRKQHKRARLFSPACSHCGHRHGSYDMTDGGLYDDDDDQSDSKSLSSLSVSSESASTSKTGSTRTTTKNTAFESDGSSITTF